MSGLALKEAWRILLANVRNRVYAGPCIVGTWEEALSARAAWPHGDMYAVPILVVQCADGRMREVQSSVLTDFGERYSEEQLMVRVPNAEKTGK